MNKSQFLHWHHGAKKGTRKGSQAGGEAESEGLWQQILQWMPSNVSN
jgi:hypothetical protein